MSTNYTFDTLFRIPSSTCGIYCITCTATDMQYVGSSRGIEQRLRGHKYNTEHDSVNLPLLYNDIRLYGLKFFTIEILEECPQKSLLDREKYWIEVLETNVTGYNVRRRASPKGKKHGEKSFLLHLETFNLYGYAMRTMSRRICGIYCITSLDTGKQYVGYSNDLKVRLQIHRYDYIKYPEKSPRLYADMRTYGIERFQVELLEECTQSELASRERYWLDTLGTEYNGYNFFRKDFKHTDETKQRFSLLRKGRVFSDEHRQRLSQAGKRRKFSDETIKAFQEAKRKKSRLSEEDVKNIKKLIQQGVKSGEIMSAYNIDRATLHDLKYGRSWKDMQPDE